MPDLVLENGTVLAIVVPQNTVTVEPPSTNPVVLVPVPGPRGADGAAALPAVIDCGGPFDSTGA